MLSMSGFDKTQPDILSLTVNLLYINSTTDLIKIKESIKVKNKLKQTILPIK